MNHNLKNNRMKTDKKHAAVCCKLAVFALLLGGCADYPEYTVTNPPFVNISALEMYISDEVQIYASPEEETFKWTVDNEDVVSVSQTGLVTALAEGLATITVASANDAVKIDVQVKTFIPLEDITVTVQSVDMDVNAQTQIWAFPLPENASEYTFIWTSSDPSILNVDQNGIVRPVSLGTAEVIIASGDIEKRVTVNVIEMMTSIPVQFSGPSEMWMEWMNESYWDMNATGGDPYCYTSTIGVDLREKIEVKFVVEYQCDREITDGQIFYCNPWPNGGVSTDMDQIFEETGIDPNDESLWREYTLDLLSGAIKGYGWGEPDHSLRFDFVGAGPCQLLVRNAQILYR
jgi:hypothetical protein